MARAAFLHYLVSPPGGDGGVGVRRDYLCADRMWILRREDLTDSFLLSLTQQLPTDPRFAEMLKNGLTCYLSYRSAVS